jgi:glucose/arabinose dehydrogenase
VSPRALIALPALSLVLLASCSSGGADPGQATAAATGGVRLKAVGNFSAPTYVTAPPGDRQRLFVVERAGRIRVMQNGRKLSAPFLDISSQVRTDGERGLLSMAFAPDYAQSGLFYAYFTAKSGDIHIQEFKRSSGDPDRADPASARDLLTIGHREFSNHNGGQLQFGPDGRLYAGIGDGGSEGDPHRNGQSLGTDLAKLLRLDPRQPSGGRQFGVAGNPFVSRSGARPEIWAYGLRNPYRFSFDRRTGDLVIADVGQDAQEEIDFARRGRGRGANYGWSVFEGARRYRGGSAPGAVRPRLVTRHSDGYCSIIGGYVVRDRSLKSLYGRYVYGDLCKPGVRSVKLGRSGGARGDRPVGVSVRTLVSFGEDGRGRVYTVSLDGRVSRFVAK